MGAFCRAYDIPEAIATFIPEVYTPAGENRYTYAAGSTTGGAVVYDDGKYLYSHHATDPAGGQLLNAWDLVRVHRFGDLDKGVQPGTAPGNTPSWQAMRQLATKDPKAGQLYNDETAAAAADAHSLDGFSPVDTSENQGADDQPADAPQPDDGKWREQLTCNSKGAIACTTQNAWLILEHDPKTAGRIWMDTFSERLRCKGPLPWPGAAGERDWTDADDAGARWYLETVYHLSGTSKVQDAVSLTGSNHARDPVREYLEGLKWDGQPRLDTLFIDYLGAEDTEYTRAVTRKMFVAAVRRAFIPGCKFDQICILSGIQGIGKDTLLSRMGRQWYNDSITSFDGKDAREALRGVWIVELGEMNAFNRSEIEAAKQFLSQTEDRYRAAYGRRSVAYPRRCVFFGTSNVDDYLRDATGNRRYWPIDCEKEDPANTKKNVYNDLTPQRGGPNLGRGRGAAPGRRGPDPDRRALRRRHRAAGRPPGGRQLGGPDRRFSGQTHPHRLGKLGHRPPPAVVAGPVHGRRPGQNPPQRPGLRGRNLGGMLRPGSPDRAQRQPPDRRHPLEHTRLGAQKYQPGLPPLRLPEGLDQTNVRTNTFQKSVCPNGKSVCLRLPEDEQNKRTKQKNRKLFKTQHRTNRTNRKSQSFQNTKTNARQTEQTDFCVLFVVLFARKPSADAGFQHRQTEQTDFFYLINLNKIKYMHTYTRARGAHAYRYI